MKSLQFHVTIAVPDGFHSCADANHAFALHSLIRSHLAQLLTPPASVFAIQLPKGVSVTVTPEL